MISKKFMEKNKQKVKNKVIKEDISLILSSLSSLTEKEFENLKNISKEKLDTLSTKLPNYYYYMKGILYFLGPDFNPNFKQDFTLSYKNLKKAHETTNSSDMLEDINIRINRMIMYGIGTNANPAQGFQNYLHYKSNNTDLKQYNQFMIGHSYLFGNGTEQNFNKAYEHFNKAGKYAYEMLAFMYSSGIGVDKNVNKALELMNKTQNKDYNKAIIYISNNDYTKGKYHLKKCYKIDRKCQKTYRYIYKYDYYDKLLNIMSYI